MKIAPFAVEQWMNAYETKCRYNLAETCVESLTIAELLEMAGQRATILDELLPLKMTYGLLKAAIGCAPLSPVSTTLNPLQTSW